MPYIIRPKAPRKLVAALFGSMLLIAAAPVAASAACPSNPVSALLAQFGDNSAYSVLPSSSFESGAAGWTLNNAEVVSGEGANGGSYSLEIEPNGVAISPQFCVSSEYPSFRFFARQLSGSEFAPLNVSLRWTDFFGHRHETPVASLQDGSEWTLSPVLRLAGALPLWMRGSTLKVQVVFQPFGGGSWAIDDVYIDPYSR
jgi:hypothetical protein